MEVGLAANSTCRCASTPSFCNPGSTPSSWAESENTSSNVMVSVSPLGLVTTHCPSASVSRFGAFIQLSGLYAPPSAWMATQPSALTMSKRVAMGRWALSRPA